MVFRLSSSDVSPFKLIIIYTVKVRNPDTLNPDAQNPESTEIQTALCLALKSGFQSRQF